MTTTRMLIVALLAIVATAATGQSAQAQLFRNRQQVVVQQQPHCAAGQVCVKPQAYVQSYTPYYAPYYVQQVVVQQDYFVEPQVTEVVEIHANAKDAGFAYYGDYYPNRIAVIREVVSRRTIVVPAADPQIAPAK